MTTSDQIDHARLWHDLAEENRRHHDAIAAIVSRGRELAAAEVKPPAPVVVPMKGD